MPNLDAYHGISKIEAVDKLNQMGYAAIWDKGVVQIALLHNGTQHTEQEIVDTLKQIDYRMSFGFSYYPDRQAKSEAGM